MCNYFSWQKKPELILPNFCLDCGVYSYDTLLFFIVPLIKRNLPASLEHIPEERLVLDEKHVLLFHPFQNPEFIFFLFVNQHKKAFLALTAPETNMKIKKKDRKLQAVKMWGNAMLM